MTKLAADPTGLYRAGLNEVNKIIQFFSQRRIMLTALALLIGVSASATAHSEHLRMLLEGEYQVVALRKASLVLSTPEDPSLEGVGPGERIRFGPELRWLWQDPQGRSCPDWSVQLSGEPVVFLPDDMLSDTQVTGEGARDFRINAHLVVKCAQQYLGRVLAVDNRVLITASPSGQTYLLLERLPEPAVVRQVQQALASRGFGPIAVNGVMDSQTRRALAVFAGQLGAEYDFNATALSNNLLAALGLEALAKDLPADRWTDDSIEAEIRRYRLRHPLPEGAGTWLILSEFFDTGTRWIEADTQNQTDPAHLRLAFIRSFLEGLPSLEYSSIADQLQLLELERAGDWLCFIALDCYPKGWVVGLGPLERPLAGDICELFRRNGWFCAQIE